MAAIDKTILYNKLGEAIKQARKDFISNDGKKLTQQELAVKLGVKRTSISNIEAGKQYPPLHLIYEITTALNLQLKDLLPTVAGTQLNSFECLTLDDKTILAPNKVALYVETFSKKGA